MLDTENVREQEALGIIGVNLIYGAFYHLSEPEICRFADDGLNRERIEVRHDRFSGPASPRGQRLMSLQLVSRD